MEYNVEDHGLTHVVYLSGDLTFADIEEISTVLHEVIRQTSSDIIVDMSKVGHVDSNVTGQFLAAHREAKSHHRDLVLSCPSPSTRETFHSSHTDNLVKSYESTEEAIAELAEKSRGGEKRKVVPNIKCGHSDCVFYTYTKVVGQVVPACQYTYPDEITNGPGCRCYRVNWKQWNATAGGEAVASPFKGGQKKSPYEIRSPAALEDSSPDAMESSDDPFAEANFPSSQSGEGTGQAALPPVEEEIVVPRISDPRERLPGEPMPPPSKSPPMNAVPPPVEETSAPEPPIAPPAPPTEAPPPAAEAPPVPLPPPVPEEPEFLEPEDVIRQYLEGWNEGRFAVEYKHLSKENRTLPVEDYCERRRAVKATQITTHGKSTVQEVAHVDSTRINGDNAGVEITRLDRTPHGTRCYAQQYTLKKEEGFWRIRMVEDGEERRNPTVPPKGRKMNAGNFASKERELKKPPQHMIDY